MNRAQTIERSLITEFRKPIWRMFIKALKDYELINENDAVMVCISGGKDSFILAKCVQELERHGRVPFTARYVCMDPGYADENRKRIEDNANEMGIPIEFFPSPIFEAVFSGDFDNPCYFCAKMRRGYLYQHAQAIGCNKIALGHHFDDVIETTLLSMFYGSEIKTMMPKLHSDNYEGLELIRPLYHVREDDIIHFAEKNELSFLNCACKITADLNENDDGSSKRLEMKKLIRKMSEDNPNIPRNIFSSMHNVNLDCVITWKSHGQAHSFLETYDDKEDD